MSIFIVVVVVISSAYSPPRTHEGSVTCVSFQIAMVSLSQGRLEEKQRCEYIFTARFFAYKNLPIIDKKLCLY